MAPVIIRLAAKITCTCHYAGVFRPRIPRNDTSECKILLKRSAEMRHAIA
jgi:hypothetical protein